MKNFSKLYFFSVSFICVLVFLVTSIISINEFIDHYFLKKYNESSEKSLGYAKAENLISSDKEKLPNNFDFKVKEVYEKKSYTAKKLYVKNFFIMVLVLSIFVLHFYFGFKENRSEKK